MAKIRKSNFKIQKPKNWILNPLSYNKFWTFFIEPTGEAHPPWYIYFDFPSCLFSHLFPSHHVSFHFEEPRANRGASCQPAILALVHPNSNLCQTVIGASLACVSVQTYTLYIYHRSWSTDPQDANTRCPTLLHRSSGHRSTVVVSRICHLILATQGGLDITKVVATLASTPDP